MEKSPKLPGEQYTDQLEKQKELAYVLDCEDFLDKIALLRAHTHQTQLVSAFAVYKNGGFKIGEIVSCIPEEVPSITVDNDEFAFRQKTIHCQDNLDCTQYGVDPQHNRELFMIVHSHPKNNSHCLRTNHSDLLVPSIDDLNNWNQLVDSGRDVIEGVLVNEEDCQGLMLFKRNPKLEISPIWNIFGHSSEETISKKEVKSVMQSSGVLVAEIKLDCQLPYYHKQVNQAAKTLSH